MLQRRAPVDKALGAGAESINLPQSRWAEHQFDPVASAHDIRNTFARMAMNDEETAALIAGATPSARP